jgi:hypothetical protein
MQDHHWYKSIGERAAKLVAGLECLFEALNCLCACCVLRLFVPAHNSVNKEWIPILVGFRNWDREWSSIVCHLTVDNVLCYTVCKFDGSDFTFWSIRFNKRIRICCWDQSLDHGTLYKNTNLAFVLLSCNVGRSRFLSMLVTAPSCLLL